jgi:SsrA-binding protein
MQSGRSCSKFFSANLNTKAFTFVFIVKGVKGVKEIPNKSAYYHYAIEQTYTAGMILTGTEIKSLRSGQASFNDCFCLFEQGEMMIKNLHIPPYKFGNNNNHDEVRDRKLLLTKQELRKIENKKKEKGYTLIPLRIFFSASGYAKIDIALAKGKKTYDKRDSIKQKDQERELKRNFKY